MPGQLCIFHLNSEIREVLLAERKKGLSVGFVPTMGALHEGHLTLIRRAQQTCDYVLVSIFVNPRQFNSAEDLERYPRTLISDIQKLERCGCHYLYAPDEHEVYRNEDKRQWDFGEGQHIMEGRFRPGHFEGMLSVVHQLLNILTPDHLFMGEKDFQQAWLVRRLVTHYHQSIQFHLVDTVREPDGLAMSSRNKLLSIEERNQASAIPRALDSIRNNTEASTLEERIDAAGLTLQAAGIRLDYLEARDENHLGSVTDIKKARIFFAGFVGNVRLIDNLPLNR